MARLYRATTEQLPIGPKLRSKAFDLAAIPDNFRRETEGLLQQRCPKGRPQRLSSWFACDKPSLAAKYLDAQLKFRSDGRAREGDPHLYAVDMESSSRQPMILVDAVVSRLSKGQSDIAASLATEYWTPTIEWQFWEYISPEVVVLEELPWPNAFDLAVALQTYMTDFSRLERLCANQKSQNPSAGMDATSYSANS